MPATTEMKLPKKRVEITLRGDPDDPRFWIAAAYRAMGRNRKVWSKAQTAEFQRQLNNCNGPDEVIELVEKHFVLA